MKTYEVMVKIENIPVVVQIRSNNVYNAKLQAEQLYGKGSLIRWPIEVS